MIFTQLSLFSLLAVFASSAVAAMGLGGGTVLLLYLSFFSALSQPQMQAVNLLLFLPAAALSLFFHRKNGLIVPRVLLPQSINGRCRCKIQSEENILPMKGLIAHHA